MSVINKMLRDLDQRQARATASPAAGGSLPTGTAAAMHFAQSAPAPGVAPRYARPFLLALACAVLALVAGAAWWAWQPAGTSSRAVVALAAPLAPAASAPVLAPAPNPAQAGAIALAVPLAGPVAASPAPTLVAPVAPVASVKPPGTPARSEPVALGLRMDTALAPRKPADRAPPAELPKGPTPNEALERAQALWTTGSRDTAIDMLQDAVAAVVAAAERGGAGASLAQGNSVLLPLVRELTRMQLAESRHSAVWDLLTRLESQLGNASDLWAIRANAAQRLGRHQDSVHAYMAALQLRPNEQRWQLGAAVSLAALGQTSSAAEMADKARAAGTVSPEVLAYLRQMGVPLKEK